MGVKSIASRIGQFLLGLMLLVAFWTSSGVDCYDPLDPSGNITITFDIHGWTPAGYVARVTVQNYYKYRHVESPGWTLGWSWTMNEVIWSMSGAFATVRGDCSAFKYDNPHSCNRNPEIADLMPDSPWENKSENCCHGGILSGWAIDPSHSFSSFEMTVGNLASDNTSVHPPANLTLLAPGPGYTCGPVLDAPPTVYSDIGGRRKIQVFRTWKSTCTYSSFLANKTPVCCVSFSTFFNSKVTSCPKCSCGCRDAPQNTALCVRSDASSGSDMDSLDIVQCTDHMCPVRIHWHVKTNYLDYWRVKLTISNYNYKRNYSSWNVLVQHPGFSQNATTYSFNSKLLPTVGYTDEVALFWGIPYFNDDLLQASELQLGSVTTDIVLMKDKDAFTLHNGWSLPRRVYFSGEECAMPPPDTFPMLPNGSNSNIRPPHCLLIPLLIYLITYLSVCMEN